MLLAMKAINTPTTSYCPPCRIQCSSFLTVSCARLSSVQNFFRLSILFYFFLFYEKITKSLVPECSGEPLLLGGWACVT